jgi:hypothetical protein
MLFINNKYTSWYFSIIQTAQHRQITGYTERHHIIPKSLGGSDKKDNLVKLTAKEHFICHRLLPRMTTGNDKRKMIYAQNMMLCKTPKQHRHLVNARTYKSIKEQFNRENPFKDPKFVQESINRHTGSKRSNESRQKMKEAWTADRKELQKNRQTGTKRNKQSPLKGCKRPELTGEKNGFYGKHHTPETIARIKEKNKDRIPAWIGTKLECPYCNRILDPGNYKQFHGENCRVKFGLPPIIKKEKKKVEKPISVDGIIYKSLRTASKELGIKECTLSWRTRSTNFPNCFYLL